MANFATFVAKTYKTEGSGLIGYCYWRTSCIWAIKICNFKMDVIKGKLNFAYCNFGLKSYLWFQNVTCAARSFNFGMRMILDQIALHSVQLPLLGIFCTDDEEPRGRRLEVKFLLITLLHVLDSSSTWMFRTSKRQVSRPERTWVCIYVFT